MPSYGGNKKRVAKRKAKKAAKGDPSLYNIAGKPKRRMVLGDSTVLKRGKAYKGASGRTEYPYTVKKKK